MQLTHRFKIPYNQNLYERIKQKSYEAGNVWSDVVKYANEYYKTTKKWLSKSDLETFTKNTYNLSSQTVQGIVAKYETNRQATKELRKNNKKIKYPWKYKTFFCLPYKQASLEIKDDVIVLKNSDYAVNFSLKKHLEILNKKRQTKKEKLRFEKFSKQKDYIEIPNLTGSNVTNISYAEVVFKDGFYWFSYVIDVAEKENSYPQKTAGCDLGEIHAAAVATEDKALIVSGRAIRSLKQYKQKMLAELNKKMSRCKKGSRQWRKYKQARVRLISKTNKQLEYLYHKTTKQTIDFLVNEKVTDFVVGDPKGLEKNTKKNKTKKQKNTKSRRQQLSSWSYGKIKDLLKYKAKLNGINIYFVNEAYTSQDCPFCGDRHKANGRNFICSVTKQKIHRDVNGALNIARKKYKMETKSVDVLHRQPLWYERFYLKKTKVSPVLMA